MSPVCYLNGSFVPVSEAKIGVYDIGLLRGFGIYEAMTTFNRKPFMLADHLARFRKSAASLSITIPESDERFAQILDELIAKNVPEGREGVVRVVLTGGTAIEGILYDSATPTFYVLVEPLEPLPREVYETGCSVTIFDFQRQFPESKTTNYIQAVLLQKERREKGALEILYTHEGRVLECATSNFFIVKNGTIVTAKDDILLGITRKVAIDVARAHFPIEEREVSIEEMYAADEAFLTSSFKDVVPVVKVGERVIGSGAVGPVTKAVIEHFRAFAHGTPPLSFDNVSEMAVRPSN